jgi:acyl-coenzyme A thioesterase PaaI-like protein
MTDTLDGRIFGEEQQCFGCAPDHPSGFRLSFSRVGDAIETRFVPDDRHQGPPGIMHGGLVFAVADEIAVWTVIATRGKFAFTAGIDGRLLRPTRIGRELVGRGALVSERRGVARSEVVLTQGGVDVFRGTIKTMLLDRQAAERLLERPLSQEWLRFAVDE